MSARESIETMLAQLGAQPDDAFDLVGAALLLAALDRPLVQLEPYRAHLAELAAAASSLTRAPAAAALAELNRVVFDRFGYRGDTDSYEDPRNANLMHVIDRRLGLPVALGIVYLHGARALGLPAHGLNTPGHFLVAVQDGGHRLICDPFNGGRLLDAASVKRLLRSIVGDDAEVDPQGYRPMTDRAVVMRLQNNLKLRALRKDDYARAAEVLGSMVLIAPHHAACWRELAAVQARQGSLRTALATLGRALDRLTDPDDRQAVLADRARLQSQLH